MLLKLYNTTTIDFSKEAVDYYKSILDEREETRLSKMQSVVRQKNFLIGRYAIKTSLAEILNTEPKKVSIIIEPSGRPVIKSTPPFSFNISHTGEYLALVISPKKVSTDMEKVKKRPLNKLIKHFQDKEMEDKFLNMPESEQSDFFFRKWVEFESGIKYFGLSVFHVKNRPLPPFTKSAKLSNDYFIAISNEEDFDDKVFQTAKIS